jgi:ABC-type molybdate transport system substrate-binding protein
MRVAPGKIDQIGSESHHNDPKTTLSRANKFRGPYSVGSFARGSVVGLLPSALQSFVVYGTAIPAYNERPEPAIAFVKFLSEPSKKDFWKAAGFELMATGD